MKKWIDYWFMDEETEEEFLVEVEDGEGASEEAHMIAEENFEKPKLIGVVSQTEAEAMGLDTY